MADLSIKYKVVLKDSDPATPEGKATLEQSLITFLKLSEERVKELMNSLPVTLKTGCSEDEAKAFAKILRNLGALVFVEKIIPTVDSEEELADEEVGTQSLDKLKAIQKHPYFIPSLGVGVALLILLSILFKPSAQPSIVIDSSSLVSLLESQKSIRGETSHKSKKDKKKNKQQVLAGKSYSRPVAITGEVFEKNGKAIKAAIKIATESPGELTPEEIIRGVQLTWLEKGEAYINKQANNEDDQHNAKPILQGDAKLYITRGELNERIVAEAEIEQLPSVKKGEKRYIFRLRYKPKDQFINDPFFIEYREEGGYSIAINQEISMSVKLEDKESALSKLEETENKNKEKVKSKK